MIGAIAKSRPIQTLKTIYILRTNHWIQRLAFSHALVGGSHVLFRPSKNHSNFTTCSLILRRTAHGNFFEGAPRRAASSLRPC